MITWETGKVYRSKVLNLRGLLVFEWALGKPKTKGLDHLGRTTRLGPQRLQLSNLGNPTSDDRIAGL